MGRCHISLEDFKRLRPNELAEVLTAHREEEDAKIHGAWERMRFLAVVTAQPHTKKRLKLKTFLPLPWEKAPAKPTGMTSRDEAYARYQKLISKKKLTDGDKLGN